MPKPTNNPIWSCTLNGKSVELPIPTDDNPTILDLLREHLNITSPKNGCQPQAQCGCCTILVDGKPRLSCTLKPEQVHEKEITTLEGIPEQERQRIAECFVKAGGLQCGFCTPGILIRTIAFIRDNPDPTRESIAKMLRPHLCRCTGYTQIIDAIQQYADSHNQQDSLTTTTGIGSNLPRYQGIETALGQRPFVDDLVAPNMLHAAFRLTDHPRATVRRIDTTEALALPGVHRIITADDVPGDRFVGLIEKDWPIFIAVGERTNYTGDVLAVVAAENPRTARRAAVLIQIEYDIEEPVTNPHEAIKPDAPLVQPNRKSNILSHSKLKRGNTEQAFEQCAHVIEDTYTTQRIEHLFLEPESCLAIPNPQSEKSHSESKPYLLKIYSQGQGVFDDRRQIASVLGIDEQRILVELCSNGGAFGGKEDLSVQAQTALMAHLTGRPVKLTLNRQESFRLHPKRHPIEMTYKVGCDEHGHLQAVQVKMIGDTGAYASVGAKVLERAAGHCTGPYRVPNLDLKAIAVLTNNPPCGAMRGFGVNQAAFAIEGLIDRLAQKVNLDGYDIRDRNILEPGDAFITGQIMDKPFGLRKTLESVRETYKKEKYVGIACGIKNVGIGNGLPDIGRATLTIENERRIHIRTGFTEMGQGLFTVCVQFAVEATGLPANLFTVSTDTVMQLGCGQTTASRATVLAGHAVTDAAKALRTELDSGNSLTDLIGKTFHGEWISEDTSVWGTDLDKPGGPKTHFSYGFATQIAILDENGKIKKIIAAHDVGRVINPTQLKGQIYGAVHMGTGYALTENFPIINGEVQAKRINDCGVLRAHQMPEVEVILIEEPDIDGPHGARGVGEIGLIPTAPAIAGALYNYDNIIRRNLPMQDYKL